MKVITIPNLDKYQHYKDRPENPWIKWHKKCLRDHEFRQLTNSERWIFIGLVLLAVENNNETPADFRDIAKIISYSYMGFQQAINKLVKLGLISIKRIAKCYHIKKGDDSKVLSQSRVDKKRIDKSREEKSKTSLKELKDAKEVIKEHIGNK